MYDTQLYFIKFRLNCGNAESLPAFSNKLYGGQYIETRSSKIEMLWVGGLSELEDGIEPFLCGIALIIKENVHKLGMFFGVAFSLEASVAFVAPNASHQLRLVIVAWWAFSF